MIRSPPLRIPRLDNQIGAIPLAVTRHAKRDTLLAAGAAAVIFTDHDDVVEATHRYTDDAGADIIMDSIAPHTILSRTNVRATPDRPSQAPTPSADGRDIP